MGVRQSKRSVDFTVETATKGEVEGFGNEGKVEIISDSVVEKVAANGHVDGELQNGGEVQNGMEPIQNGEAAAVAAEKIKEKKEVDEPAVEGAVNGVVENGEINGEPEKNAEETKKSEEKKDKKKDKKEKVVKKKFSFRNFSFSKKDKSKPSKEEKSPGKVEEGGIEEAPKDAEKDETATSPSQDETVESPKAEEPVTVTVTTTIIEKPKAEMEQPPMEKIPEVTAPIAIASEDLPPPLPASPPPSEILDTKISSDLQETATKTTTNIVESFTGEMEKVTSSITNTMVKAEGETLEVMKDAEKIAIETGKQIEEKATNLLKTVEERAEESMRTAEKFVTQKTEDVMGAVENVLGGLKQTEAEVPEMKMEMKTEMPEMPDMPKVDEAAKKLEETLPSVPVEISNLESLSPKAEEPSDKHEEGAGESLADMPKDLAEEMTAAAIEATNPDSLEIAATLPPPLVEPATGE